MNQSMKRSRRWTKIRQNSLPVEQEAFPIEAFLNVPLGTP
jgi:hypothetical protein